MSARLSIGLDIGGTNGRAALVATTGWDGPNPQAEVLSEARARVRGDTSPDAIARAIDALAMECCETAQISRDQLSGIGIGIAGQLSADRRTVINGPNLGWRGVPFADLVERRLLDDGAGAIPVSVFNDLSGIAWGEHRCGAGAGYRDLMVVYVGTGVGCGLIVEGKLYEGSHAKAGEIGHSKVVARGGRACGCGEHGCMEAYVGGRYIELRVAEDLHAGRAEDLRAFLGMDTHTLPNGEAVMPSEIDRAAGAGVAYAARLWDEAADAFALVMSACLALQNPSGWLLGGGVLDHCPLLRQRLLARTAALTVQAIWRDVTVLTPTLGDRAGLIGAALLALEPAP
jgi:glucokinase